MKEIIDEIIEMGFDRGRTQAYQNINRLRSAGNIEARSFTEIQQELIPYIKPLNSRKLTQYIGCNLSDIADPGERDYMNTLLDNISELQIVRRLVRWFRTMLRRASGNIR